MEKSPGHSGFLLRSLGFGFAALSLICAPDAPAQTGVARVSAPAPSAAAPAPAVRVAAPTAAAVPAPAAAVVTAPAAPAAAPAVPAAVPITAPQSPEQIRADAEALVFQLVTRVKGAGDKQSYGTAFVVNAEGWLLTNFHVVAGALTDPSHYSLELRLADKTGLPASIESFDVPNDLALIRVGHVFPAAYRLSTRALSPGEKLYSLGLPQDTVMSIVEGLYSDTGRMGPLRRSLMSAPLNHGMSGGPVVNTSNELVGVNDAILPEAQSISVLVPSAAIAEFLGRSSHELAAIKTARNPATVSSAALSERIPDQISSVLRPWIDEWRSQSPDGVMPLGHFRLAPPPPGLKCWEDAKAGGDLGNAHGKICSTVGAFPILPSRVGGQLTLRYTSLTPDHEHSGTSDGSLSADRLKSGALLASNLFAQGMLNKASERFAKTAQPSDDGERRKAEMVCHHRFLKNKSGVELVAQYCLSADHPLNGVYDLVLTAMPVAAADSGDALAAELDLNGFTGPELLMAGETFLDGISRDDGSSSEETR